MVKSRWQMLALLLAVAGIGSVFLTTFAPPRVGIGAGRVAPTGPIPVNVMEYAAPSSSMAPTLTEGDWVSVAPHAYEGKMPSRGDVVVFEYTGGLGANYIKRVVGLPGDRIQLKDGVLHINDIPVTRIRLPDSEMPEAGTYAASLYDPRDRPQFYEETFPDGHRHRIQEIGDIGPDDNSQEFTVPPGHYFMMGDDRDVSTDSRHPVTGFIPHENLRGRVLDIYWARAEMRTGTPVE